MIDSHCFMKLEAFLSLSLCVIMMITFNFMDCTKLRRQMLLLNLCSLQVQRDDRPHLLISVGVCVHVRACYVIAHVHNNTVITKSQSKIACNRGFLYVIIFFFISQCFLDCIKHHHTPTQSWVI
jgi:hypothetical protein